MRELNISEIKEVTGGNIVVGFLIGYIAGKVLDAAVEIVVEALDGIDTNSTNMSAATNRL